MTDTSTEIQLFDSHCHLDMEPSRQAVEQALERAHHAGVTRILAVGITVASSHQATVLAAHSPGVVAAVGLHPHEAGTYGNNDLHAMEQLVQKEHGRIAAYGEIGLDYAKMYAPAKAQQQLFIDQLRLAKRLQLPVIIHSRDADADMLALLTANAPYPHGGILHCFTGGLPFARKLVELGFFLSLSGIVTFPNAKQLHETARWIPDDRLLLETDAPFLAPHAKRGKKNEPAFLRDTAEHVAALRGVSLASLAAQTTANACRLLGCP